MTNPLVLFSGGLDSTYLVSHLLQYGPVDILYVNGGQCKNKIAAEIKARDKLIAKLNQFYPHKIQAEYEILEPLYRHSPQSKAYTQPNAWIQGAYRILDKNRHSSLQIAYVSDDGAGFGAVTNDIKDLWAATLKVGYSGEHVPLEFPLLHTSKLEILEKLDKRLLQDIWVCELPINEKHCGDCKPCTLMRNVLSQYKQKHGETVWNTALRTIRELTEPRTRIEQREWHKDSSYVLHDHNYYENVAGHPRRIKPRSTDAICQLIEKCT